jgi:hypothetical protein
MGRRDGIEQAPRENPMFEGITRRYSKMGASIGNN